MLDSSWQIDHFQEKFVNIGEAKPMKGNLEGKLSLSIK